MVETLKNKEPSLVTIEDKGRQIAIECPTPADTRMVNEQVNNLKTKAKALRMDAEKKLNGWF